MDTEVLFKSNIRPLASPESASRVKAIGLERAVQEIPLLPDTSGMAAWRDWHDLAGLKFTPKKILFRYRMQIPAFRQSYLEMD